MSEKQPPRASKPRYEKPRLKPIELVAEEVLGVGCKAETAGMAIGVPCSNGQCAGIGS
jgi:hypothetical protein